MKKQTPSISIHHLFAILLLPLLAISDAAERFGSLDSGGGKANVGTQTNHGSIGGGFASSVVNAGTITVRSGLIDLVHTPIPTDAGISEPASRAIPPGTNPVIASVESGGKYAGFLSSADGETVAGYFKSIKVSPSGKFSAMFYIGGVKFVCKGHFDENGQYQTSITSKSGSPANVELRLVETEGGGYKIEGTVTAGEQATVLKAVKAGANDALAGAYTLLIPAEEDEPDAPQGHGFGLMTVSSSGAAKIKGLLADGSKWTAKCMITPDGEMPLYTLLYRKAGSLGGMVRFRDLAGVSDCDGQLHWIKPGGGGHDLRRGLMGSRFNYIDGQRLLDSTSDSVPDVIAFLGAGSGVDATELEFNWDTSNKINYLGAEKVKLKASTKNGWLKGKASIDDDKWNIAGVVFQKQDLVAGVVYTKGGQPRKLIMKPTK